MRRVSVLLALCLMFFGPSQSKADIYHYDGRGDVVGQTDSGGNLTYQSAYTADGTHDPNLVLGWGAAESPESDGHSLQANTKPEEGGFDEFGGVNDKYRYRSFLTGRYSVRDPSGYPDGNNPYTYVNNNPWTKLDPLGLQGGYYKGAVVHTPIQELPGSMWAGLAEMATDAAYGFYATSTPGLSLRGAGHYNDSAKTFTQGMAQAHADLNAGIDHNIESATGYAVDPTLKTITQTAAGLAMAGEGIVANARQTAVATQMADDAKATSAAATPAASAADSPPGMVPQLAQQAQGNAAAAPAAAPKGIPVVAARLAGEDEAAAGEYPQQQQAQQQQANAGAGKPSSPGKMQMEVLRDQAPKGVKRVDPGHVPGQEPHIHYDDGTSSTQSGGVHDAGNGTPDPSNSIRDWLVGHGWTPPPKT